MSMSGMAFLWLLRWGPMSVPWAFALDVTTDFCFLLLADNGLQGAHYAAVGSVLCLHHLCAHC